jgi:hypothetical protein
MPGELPSEINRNWSKTGQLGVRCHFLCFTIRPVRRNRARALCPEVSASCAGRIPLSAGRSAGAAAAIQRLSWQSCSKVSHNEHKRRTPAKRHGQRGGHERLRRKRPRGQPLRLRQSLTGFWVPRRTALPRLDPERGPQNGCHVLRHTAASAWLSAGLSLAKGAAYLGDTKEAVLATYPHFMPDDDRAREIIWLVNVRPPQSKVK